MTNVAGLCLQTCLMNASGCWCRTKDELDDLLKSSMCSVIVSKTCTMEPRIGNPEPRFCLIENGSINSMGIPNFGFQFYLDYFRGIQTGKKQCMQSIFPQNCSQCLDMLLEIEKSKFQTLVEINLSCPNLTDAEADPVELTWENTFVRSLTTVLKEISSASSKFQQVKIGLKMPLFYYPQQFDRIARILNQSKIIQFITCSNSLPNGLIIDTKTEQTVIHPKGGMGGIGGDFIKPMSLSNVYQFYTRLLSSIDIIGCGGIKSGSDVFEYILCGAKAVQIGTELIRHGPQSFERIHKEFEALTLSKGYSNINEFCGKLKVTCPENHEL
jgi:dihydroorotate dehydrogenase (fumarate)